MAVGDRAPEHATANQSIERAARLLGFFSVEQPELSLAELTARLGTSRATTHRYLTALRRAGLVRQARGVYALGYLNPRERRRIGYIRVAPAREDRRFRHPPIEAAAFTRLGGRR